MNKLLSGKDNLFGNLPENRTLPLVLTAIWLAVSLAYAIGYYFTDPRPDIGFTQVASALLALVLPLLLIWGAFAFISAITAERRKADRLEEGMEILYAEIQDLKAKIEARPVRSETPEVINLPDQSALLKLSSEVAQLSTLMKAHLTGPDELIPAPAKPQSRKKPLPEAEQPLLPMDAPGNGAEISRDELVSAFNFPKDERDSIGFAILKKARQTREVAQVLQAAEDVLTLLAQEGIYMDDLAYASVPVKQWRSFARGARGAQVEQMAAILDSKAENKARETIRKDPVFRDTSLHFQRHFDALLSEFCDGASDAELAAFANTRTARAFVLLSKVSGVIGGPDS